MKKKKAASNSAFFNLRIVFGLALGLFGVTLSLFAAGVLPATHHRTQPVSNPNGGLKNSLGQESRRVGPIGQKRCLTGTTGSADGADSATKELRG